MRRLTLWGYIILMFLIGALGWLSTVWTLERQVEHPPSLTDQLAQKYPQ